MSEAVVLPSGADEGEAAAAIEGPDEAAPAAAESAGVPQGAEGGSAPRQEANGAIPARDEAPEEQPSTRTPVATAEPVAQAPAAGSAALATAGTARDDGPKLAAATGAKLRRGLAGLFKAAGRKS